MGKMQRPKRRRQVERVVEINTLEALICQHCGCMYLPAEASKGVCPVSNSHTEYLPVSLTLAKKPEKWTDTVVQKRIA
jgi:hypothetical protein